MKSNVLVTSILVAIGVAVGFLVGRSTGKDGADSDGRGVGAERRPEGGSLAGASADRGGARGGATGEGRSGRSPAATIRQVARDLELSPMLNMDFESMLNTYESIRWMSPKEIEEALGELDSVGGNPQARMVLSMMLISLWAKQDGQGAVEFALKNGDAMSRSMGIMGGLMGWMRSDPEGAYAWFDENREEVKKSGMMGAQMEGLMLASLSQQDMPGTFARLSKLNRQEQRHALAMMSAQMIMDPTKRDEFVKQIDTLEDESLRNDALQGMVTVWAYQDPKAAVAFLDSREWDAATESTLRQGLAASWASVDAEGALTWRLENLSEGEDKGAAAASGFAQWMTQDPVQATEWLKKQPPELRTDQLYQQTAIHLQVQQNFAEAADWAVQIEEQTTRDGTLQQVYQSWKQSDGESAQQWLEGLEPATQEAVKNAAQAIGGTDAVQSLEGQAEKR